MGKWSGFTRIRLKIRPSHDTGYALVRKTHTCICDAYARIFDRIGNLGPQAVLCLRICFSDEGLALAQSFARDFTILYFSQIFNRPIPLHCFNRPVLEREIKSGFSNHEINKLTFFCSYCYSLKL